mmetsp:Transcript_39568/g.77329  ORF Transcript_39568/g.77329 Transcript_39568/m.77329 type:complete len:244 (+) Transcript_39568:134-865(+)
MEHSDAIGVTPKPPRRVGLIGLGAIGETVAKALLRNSATTGVPPAPGASPDGVDGAALCAVLVRDVSRHDEASWLDGILITSDADAFFAARPEVVVEAAGQPAVAAYAEQALRTGADFIAASTGALTDDSLRRRIVATARTAGCGRMHLASGAMPGLDWMQAAAMGGGPSRVAVVQSKPPGAWAGTPGAAAAAAVGDWVAHGPLTIFEGNARRAASEFPKTSNVTATLALATVGLDATQSSVT